MGRPGVAVTHGFMNGDPSRVGVDTGGGVTQCQEASGCRFVLRGRQVAAFRVCSLGGPVGWAPRRVLP